MAFLTALVKSMTGTGKKKKNCKDDDTIQLVHLEALNEAAKEEYEGRASASSAFPPEDTLPEDQLEIDA